MIFNMFNRRSDGLDALFDRQQPPQWRIFLASPSIYLAKKMYSAQRPREANKPNTNAITVIFISDTHNFQPTVPHGDLLIHAGDLTQSGTVKEIQAAIDWIKSLSHPYKIVIAGNHDIVLGSKAEHKFDWDNIHYLQDSSQQIQFSNGRNIKIFGSPWTSPPGTWAFHYVRDEDVWTKKVPDDTNILVTHGPPRFHLDADGLGDANLLEELWRVRPRLHVFRHIHYGYGRNFLAYDRFERCYESILRGSKRVVELLWMIGHFIGLRWRTRPTFGTELVNAAIVGGLRDDERRDPLVVLL